MSQSLTGLRFDMTWNSFIVWIWLIVECDLAIICISVPVLRVLVKKYLPRAAGRGGHTQALPTHRETPVNNHHHGGGLKQDPSFSSLMQESKSIGNADGIEMYNRPIRTDSARSVSTNRTGPVRQMEQRNEIVGYDRYGQPIFRDDTHRHDHAKTGPPRAF
jgi:rhodopsin domain-containing protein